MGYKYLITLCLCLCYGNISELGAQTSHRILKTLTTEEGLSSNKINDIVQDEDGFLWIATNDGLNRYDGTVVLQYFYQDSVNSIPNNYINCLIKLRGNYLAIGTEAGLSFYDSRRGVFRNFYFKMNNALDVFNNSIVKMEIDASGNLWAVSRNSIFIFDEDRRLKKIISSPFTEADAARQRLRFVEKIFPLSDGNMLLYLFNGWHICRRGSFDIIALDRTNYDAPLLYLKELVQQVHKKKEQYFPSANLFKVFSTYFISVKPGQDSLLLFDEKGIRHDQCFFPFNQYPFVSWTQHLVAMDKGKIFSTNLSR